MVDIVKVTIQSKRKAGYIISFGEAPFTVVTGQGTAEKCLIPDGFTMLSKAP